MKTPFLEIDDKTDDKEEINFISEKVIYNEGNEQYTIKLGTNNSKEFLVFKIIPENYKQIYYFQNKYRLTELQQLSQAFNYYKSIEEIIFSFPKMKYNICEKDDQFIIQFNLFSPLGKNLISELPFTKIFNDKEKAIKDLLEEKKSLQKIIDELKNKINYLESNNVDKKNQIILTNESEIKQLKQKIEFFDEENYRFKKKNENLKTEIDRLNNEMASIYENYNKSQIDLIKEKNDYKRQNEDLFKKYQKLKVDNDGQIKDNQELKKEYKELLNNYQKLKEVYEICRIKNEKLERENKSLKIDPFKGDNSNIIDQMDELQFIFTYIKQEDPHFQFNNLRLLYRGSRDGDNTETCHKLCDEKKNVLILIKSIKGNTFGGFSKIGFKTKDKAEYVVDNDCFLFSVDLKRIYPSIKNKQNICHINKFCGLCFNGSIAFFNNFMKSKENLIYKETIRNYFNRLAEPCEMNGGEDKFRCEELEVFQFEYN